MSDGFQADGFAPDDGFQPEAAAPQGTTARVLRWLWDAVKPGQYPKAPPAPARLDGESDEEYVRRSGHEALRWMGSPEGTGNALAMVGYTMPGGKGDLKTKPGEAVPATALKPPRLEVAPAAQALEARGVPLTVGQRAPRSLVGGLERVSEDNPLGMRGAREAAKEAWRDVVRREPVKAGDTRPLAGSDAGAAMEDVYQRFGPEYDAIRSQPVTPESVAGMPEAAMKLPGGIDARTKRGASGEIQNALTVLDEPPAFKAPAQTPGASVTSAGPGLTAGDLMKVRGNIREQIRAARQSQDFDKIRLLEHAEDVVTGTLEQNLSPEAQAALRDVDRRYAIFNTIEDATARAGMEGNFSPKQLGGAVRKAAGRRSFAQGGGGELRDLSEAGDQTFSEAPMTGFRAAVLSAMPWGSKLSAPLARLANTEAGRRFLFEPRQRLFTPPGGGPTAEAGMQLEPFLEWLRSRARPSTVSAEEDR